MPGVRDIGAALAAAPRYLVGALMIVITLLVNVEIFLRFFVNLPLDAVSEIVLTLFPWLSLLGAAVALTIPGAHVALHLMNPRMSRRKRLFLDVLMNLTTASFGVFLVIQGINYSAMTGSEISNELEIPRSWQTGAFPAVGVLFIIYSVVAMARMRRKALKHEDMLVESGGTS